MTKVINEPILSMSNNDSYEIYPGTADKTMIEDMYRAAKTLVTGRREPNFYLSRRVHVINCHWQVQLFKSGFCTQEV